MSVAAGRTSPVLVVKASELTGLPVVSITEGEALADIKDVLYSPDEGRLIGFTLNKHGGLFAGPMKSALAMEAVFSIGRAAVMVQDRGALDLALTAGGSDGAGHHRNVIKNQVLTESGERLGEVSDLIVEVGVVRPSLAPLVPGATGGRVGDVVGYEIIGDAALQGRQSPPVFLPLPYTLSVSGENLIVPSSVETFIRDDLSGFGGALSDFRAQLGPRVERPA